MQQVARDSVHSINIHSCSLSIHAAGGESAAPAELFLFICLSNGLQLRSAACRSTRATLNFCQSVGKLCHHHHKITLGASLLRNIRHVRHAGSARGV